GKTTGNNFSSTTSNASNWATTTTKAVAHAVLSNLTRGVADSVIRGITSQIAGGFTGSAGMNWTKTTTVGEELLNRRAEAVEESLKAYENRLMEGMAVGMWNLGHYFCASNTSTFDQGCGIITSLFSGMDSKYEPPRVIRLPQELRNILRCFKNLQLKFTGRPINSENFKDGNVKFVNHPLGDIFNGPTTPVNTKELAIATPIAKQDVEGVTVTERADFGINLGRNIDEKTISIGNVLDKGNDTRLKYRLNLKNLQKHLAVFGLTGSGKTNTVHSLLMQLWKNHKIPFMVIEPAKAEYRALAEMEELKDDLLVISAGVNRTEVCPLRLNPFDFDPGSDSDASRIHVLTHIDRLKSTFNASFPMYASMPYILEEAILEVYRERGWDLGQSQNRYVDIYSQDFSEYLPSLHDLYLKIDSIVERKGYYQEQQMNIQAALKARLSSLMVGAKGSMFNCSRSIPSKDLFNRPVVIELENMGDDDEKSFLMGLLISRLYEYRKATFSKTEDNCDFPCHVLVIEEAHRLLQNIPEAAENMETASVKGKAVSFFVDMLSEIRAMRQSVIIVDQLPSRFNTNIVKGTGSKIVHRLLAKDDREAVGNTIGLNDNQIKDIALFRTGEAVVNQDGERKAYMVRVTKNTLHENRMGGEVSKATIDFKEKWKQIFNSIPFDIDQEDWLFKDELHKIMLYGIFEQNVADKLEKIKPSNLYAKWENKEIWFDIYWKQICDEIWNYYSGYYGSFVKFRRIGSLMLKAFVKGSNKISYEIICDYQRAGKEYFNNTKSKIVYLNTVGIAYEQFFLRNRIIASINKRLSRSVDYNSFEKDLIVSIANVLPLVMPNNKADGSTELEKAIVKEILNRLSNRLRIELDDRIIALLRERSYHD
ncbi:MAG: ATP-binding protein, partial [Candidatus Riflebacteria bacterium]|nr:ATP-binding protein [Candidatus Riflebacteria bacterium]